MAILSSIPNQRVVQEGSKSIDTNQPNARTGRDGQNGSEVQDLDEHAEDADIIVPRRRVSHEEGRQTQSENDDSVREWIQLRGTKPRPGAKRDSPPNRLHNE